MKSVIITALTLIGFNVLVLLFEYYSKTSVQWFAGFISSILAMWVLISLDEDEE